MKRNDRILHAVKIFQKNFFFPVRNTGSQRENLFITRQTNSLCPVFYRGIKCEATKSFPSEKKFSPRLGFHIERQEKFVTIERHH
jgi:hypothetical protein